MVKTLKTKALTIRFSEEDWTELMRLSEEGDVPAAQIVRLAVRSYAASKKTKRSKS